MTPLERAAIALYELPKVPYPEGLNLQFFEAEAWVALNTALKGDGLENVYHKQYSSHQCAIRDANGPMEWCLCVNCENARFMADTCRDYLLGGY